MATAPGIRVRTFWLAAVAFSVAFGVAVAGSPAALEVFVAPWCPYCRALERDLTARGIPFVKRDIEADPSARARYESLGAGGLPLSRVGRRLIRGYDMDAIESALAEAGAARPPDARPGRQRPRLSPPDGQELTRLY